MYIIVLEVCQSTAGLMQHAQSAGVCGRSQSDPAAQSVDRCFRLVNVFNDILTTQSMGSSRTWDALAVGWSLFVLGHSALGENVSDAKYRVGSRDAS
jgi:hypothetical protein